MSRFFKPSIWSTVIWLFLFLAFPLPYRGACLMYVGAYCPEWTFFGGLGYMVGFFDFIITALTSKTLPAGSLLQDAFQLLPTLLIVLVISYAVTHVVFALVRKLRM